MFQTILLDKKEEGIYKLTLNRPERLNAMTSLLTQEVVQALGEVNEDPEARVLIFTGAGRGFCAGQDLSGDERTGGASQQATASSRRMALRYGPGEVVRRLIGMDFPTIAMVNGPAAGGGFDWALACDIRIGSENARFVEAFTRLGIISAAAGNWLKPRIMGLSQAARYMFTGDSLEAAEAHRIGVLDLLVPAAELETATMDMARRIAHNPPFAVHLTKMLLYKGLDMSLDATMQMGVAFQNIARGTEDAQEASAAFRERRTPTFKGR